MKMIETIRLLYNARKYKMRVGQHCIDYMTENIRPGQTIIDVGAGNAGSLYYLLRQTGAAGKLIVFEPQTERYRNIIRFKKKLNWHNVTPEHLAVSDEDGVLLLQIPVANRSVDSLVRVRILSLPLAPETYFIEGVNAETLDAYCQRKAIRPDFIKIGTGGNEADVLEGAVNLLKKYKPRILLFLDTQVIAPKGIEDISALMSWLRYTGYYLNGTQKIPLEKRSISDVLKENNGNPCCNFVFE